MLGSVLFHTCVNSVDTRIEYTRSFVGGVKLREQSVCWGRAAVQRDFNRLHKWSDGSLMEFSKD